MAVTTSSVAPQGSLGDSRSSRCSIGVGRERGHRGQQFHRTSSARAAAGQQPQRLVAARQDAVGGDPDGQPRLCAHLGQAARHAHRTFPSNSGMYPASAAPGSQRSGRSAPAAPPSARRDGRAAPGATRSPSSGRASFRLRAANRGCPRSAGGLRPGGCPSRVRRTGSSPAGAVPLARGVELGGFGNLSADPLVVNMPKPSPLLRVAGP